MEIVTKDHLAAFGGIAHYYACAESGIKIVLSGMLDIRLGELLILTEPYSSLNLRNVAKSVVKARFKPDHRPDDFLCLVGSLGQFGPLRNHVAHSRWTNGTRAESIKPFGVDIRSGTVKYVGSKPDEPDWLLEELIEQADRLLYLNSDVVKFLHESGIAERMEEKALATKAAMEASEGSSTKAS